MRWFSILLSFFDREIVTLLDLIQDTILPKDVPPVILQPDNLRNKADLPLRLLRN